MFILDRIDRELPHFLERLHVELKFGLSSEFSDKNTFLLDVLFGAFRFSKASFCALTSSFMTF